MHNLTGTFLVRLLPSQVPHLPVGKQAVKTNGGYDEYFGGSVSVMDAGAASGDSST